jgi:predicted RNase H-like HicB family nuclease
LGSVAGSAVVILFSLNLEWKKFLIFSPKVQKQSRVRSNRFGMLYSSIASRRTLTPKYEVIIYWSEHDRAFIAEVPELPGCAADGKTYQQALANVEVIIREWIGTARELDRPIPVPKGRLVFA